MAVGERHFSIPRRAGQRVLCEEGAGFRGTNGALDGRYERHCREDKTGDGVDENHHMGHAVLSSGHIYLGMTFFSSHSEFPTDRVMQDAHEHSNCSI